MMLAGIIVWVVFCLVLIGMLVWMDEKIHNVPEEPETNVEAKCREIKMRLALMQRAKDVPQEDNKNDVRSRLYAGLSPRR